MLLRRVHGVRRVVVCLGALAAWASFAGAESSPQPTRQVLSSDFSAITAPSAFTGRVSFLQRQPLLGGPVYWGWGVRGDLYSFSSSERYPVRRLQDYAVPLSLEYFVGTDPVASIVLRPGFYFENDVSFSAWDIPLDAVTGIPVTKEFSGVVGVSLARFYHHLLPVFGVSWAPRADTRLLAVFPNPSFSRDITTHLSARLYGELSGDGFRTSSVPNQSTVSYSEYRTGMAFSYVLQPGWSITVGAGYAVKRGFHFYEKSQTIHPGGAPFVQIGLELSR